MEEVVKYNPDSIMQGVKDRIKATFVGMIPDEQWEAMIKKECDEFLNGKVDNSWVSNNGRYMPEFKVIAQQELQNECKRRMAEYLSSPEFEIIWTEHGRTTCSKTVEELIIKNSGAMLTNMFGNLFSEILYNFKQSLLSQR